MSFTVPHAPVGLSFAANRIYLVWDSNRVIRVYDEDGAEDAALGFTLPDGPEIRDIAVTEDYIYVLYAGSGGVFVFNRKTRMHDTQRSFTVPDANRDGYGIDVADGVLYLVRRDRHYYKYNLTNTGATYDEATADSAALADIAVLGSRIWMDRGRVAVTPDGHFWEMAARGNVIRRSDPFSREGVTLDLDTGEIEIETLQSRRFTATVGNVKENGDVSYAWEAAAGITFDDRTSATPEATAGALTSPEDLVVTGKCTAKIDWGFDYFVARGFVIRVTPAAGSAEPGAVTIKGAGEVQAGRDLGLSAKVSGGTYDELGYKWSVEPAAAGTFDDNTAAEPTFTASGSLTERLKGVRILLTLTFRGTGTLAFAGTSAPVSVRSPAFEVRVTASAPTIVAELDLRRGSWKEVPAPGLPYELNPETMPLVAEYRAAGDIWVAKPQDWIHRLAGDDDTVPPPSFIGSTIQDLTFAQNRLVLLTPDTVVASTAGVPHLFWGASAQGVLPADPIDLDIGNDVPASALVDVGSVLVAITAHGQFQMYAPAGVGGWTPENMRISRSGTVHCNPALGVDLTGSAIVTVSSNGLLTTIIPQQNGALEVDISTRVPGLATTGGPLGLTAVQAADAWAWIGEEGGLTEVFICQRIPQGQGQIHAWSRHFTGDHTTTKSLAAHGEHLVLLVADSTAAPKGQIRLETLYLGDRRRGEDVCVDFCGGFESAVQFSPPVLYEQTNYGLAPVKRTRFQIREFTCHMARPEETDSSVVTLTARVQGRAPEVRRFTPHRLGFSESPFLTEPRPTFEHFSVPCSSEARFFNVEIASESENPFELSGGEWQGTVSGRETRQTRVLY